MQTESVRKPGFLGTLTRPLATFVALEAASTVLLLAATIAALAWANSPAAASYDAFLHLPLAIGAGAFRLELTLHHFVNDVVMTVFFFVVGMEIKRELAVGELSSPSRAALPIIAALGGMIVPAAIYAALHWNGPGLRGWGIPMATDIAFALAAMSVFGKRVPSPLHVFLLALAIADDIGAVTVIAVFYSQSISFGWLLAGVLGLGAIELLKRGGVRAYAPYVLIGIAVWYATFRSGVHATIAGVAIGLLTPAHALDDGPSPIDALEERLHGWVAFAAMPLFALCNAGVPIDASVLSDALAMRVGAATALGLVVGKPLGIALFAWIAVRLGLAELPRGVGWSAIAGAGALAGIGFTVALFVASLAFGEGVIDAGAKIGILGGSLIAALAGLAVLASALPPSADRSR